MPNESDRAPDARSTGRNDGRSEADGAPSASETAKTSDQVADAKAVPSSAAAKPAKLADKPKDETPGPIEAAPGGTLIADAAPPSIMAGPARAVAAAQVSDRAPDPIASARPQEDATGATPAEQPVDPSVQAVAVAVAVASTAVLPMKTAASSDDGPETASDTDDTPPTDATPAPPAPPQPPVALGIAAPLASVPTAGPEAKPVSGPETRSAARPLGRVPINPAASGSSDLTAPARAKGVEEAGMVLVGARPAGAGAAGETASSPPEGSIKQEAGSRVSATFTAPTDFAAQFAQLPNPTSELAAQSRPGASAASTPGSDTSRATNAVPLGDVPVEIGLRALDGSSRFDIRLSPEDLGRIDVKLDIDGDGQVRAHLVVDRPETLAFLQRDGEHLHRAFEQAGFKPAESGIAFSLRDPGQDAGGGRNGSGENGQRPPPPAWTRQADREAGPDAVPTAWRTLQAGRAGVDLRI